MERQLINKIERIDRKATKVIEERHSPLTIQFFEGITSLGAPPVTTIFILLLYAFGFAQTGITVLSGMLVSGLTVIGIKKFVSRERPENRVDQYLSRESFPSGHATNAFATATILVSQFEKPEIFLTLATLVAFSRIYLEDHYVSDVFTGSLLGLAIGVSLIMI